MTLPVQWPEFRDDEGPLEVLVKLSRYYGADPDFVLAGGGNTSVKAGDRIYVKASGHTLAAIGTDGFVALDRRKLAAVLEADVAPDPARREADFTAAILDARLDKESGRRPSVESALHNVMPGRFVVHTHSTYVNMVTCCTAGGRLVQEWFGDDVLWIDVIEPGILLARKIAEELAAYCERTGRERPTAVLMGNHGLIVSGETPDEVRRNTDRVLGKIRQNVDDAAAREAFGTITRAAPKRARERVNTIAPALRGLLSEGPALKLVAFDDSDRVMALVGGTEGRARAEGGPMTPDHIVYSGSFPLWFAPPEAEDAPAMVERLREAVQDFRTRRGDAPRVVLAAGVGMFTVGDDWSEAERARLLYDNQIKVMAGARVLGGIQPLAEDIRRFVEDWEVETYRRGVAKRRGGAGRAAGKVAVVTGAAQGFGREIAVDLADQGGHVALLDVNAEGVRAVAAALNQRLGAGRATALACDVTDADSVADAVHHVVRAYGGFDVFLSNAGVLRAGSVKTQPPREFAFVTDVNYTGYFLCVRSAAPVLATQHLARPEVWSDVIQINSKSGLVGSSRNAAYAGSKFGGIGLTQSFALELVADGVKVNAICPGNYFDGPLWSDPETGLFAQYLRAGKVPGAKTIADVRWAYEAKVPMRRGCTTADVMKAIYYLIEQTYETGQAVPVTGGQVMLS